MLSRACKLALLSGLLITTSFVLAQNHDRFQSNHDIRIEASDKANDVTCMACSIYVAGEVAGDVTAIDGNVVLENGAKVDGDTTAILGNVRLSANTNAEQDVTAVVGSVQRDSQATVKGDVTALDGGAWLFLIVILPLALLGGLIALAVSIVLWLVRRSRQSVPIAVYANTRS
jgi:hypothetical protein